MRQQDGYTTGTLRQAGQTVAAASLALLLAACSAETTELAKSGTPVSEFGSAEQFAAIRTSPETLCLQGEAELVFAAPGQQFGFAFSAQTGDSLDAALLGDGQLDTVLLLFGPDDGSGFYGRYPVALDDDGGEGVLSHLQGYAFKESGSFMLVATTYGGECRGSATLTLALGGAPGCFPVRPEPDGAVCCALVDADGQRLFASLEPERCAARNGLAVEAARCGGQIAGEYCGDGVDNDGDGEIDEGCVPQPICCVLVDPAGGERFFVSATAADCAARNGQAVDPAMCGGQGEAGRELCGDGIDNNRDGQIDEGCVAEQLCCALPTADGTLRFVGLVAADCAARGGQVVDSARCGGEGEVGNEICEDGIDNDRDGRIDEDCLVEPGCCALVTADGSSRYFVGLPAEQCAARNGIPVNAAMCGGEGEGEGEGERCGDGIDNNGDAQIDEGCVPQPICCALLAADGSSRFFVGATEAECAARNGVVVDPGRCGAEGEGEGEGERCGDGIDNNGDGQIDEGCVPQPVCCALLAADGSSRFFVAVAEADCAARGGVAVDPARCGGEEQGATELCGDGIDNDRDGRVDEDCAPELVCCVLVAADGSWTAIAMSEQECLRASGEVGDAGRCR